MRLPGGGIPLSEANKNSGGGAKRLWPLFVGLPLIVALAIAAVLLSGERSQPAGQEQPAQRPAGNGEEELGNPSLGDPGSPVVMIEYGDFQ